MTSLIMLNRHKSLLFCIIASLKSEPTCKLMNRIPGLCLLISSLPGSTSRMHVESLGKPGNLKSVLEALPGKLDIKGHSPSILYLHPQDLVSNAHLLGFSRFF